MAVSRVTIHHEGAGTPSDSTRYADGGYTYGVGPTRWYRFRSVLTSFATKGYNHVSLDICLSGDRTDIPVTDAEIRMIGECVADARSRGEVVDRPSVFPHSESFATACPGNKARERFPEIVRACQVPVVPPVDWVALAELERWRQRVALNPLRYGSRGADVAILIDLLREKHFLRKDADGDAYGLRVRRGVYRFKLAHPELGNTDGKNFGGAAARVLAGL